MPFKGLEVFAHDSKTMCEGGALGAVEPIPSSYVLTNPLKNIFTCVLVTYT